MGGLKNFLKQQGIPVKEISGAGTGTYNITAADTQGELLRIEVAADPFGPAYHSHPKGEELLEVLSGTVSYQVGSEKGKLTAGQTFTAPEGTVHSWWNESGQAVRIRIDFYPDHGLEAYLDNVYGLIGERKNLNKKGSLKLLQKAVLSHAQRDVLFEPPSYARKALNGFLAAIGRICGYKARYAGYSGPA